MSTLDERIANAKANKKIGGVASTIKHTYTGTPVEKSDNPKITTPVPKPTPLMTALSTGKTAGVTSNKNTNYKPLAVPTSAQKMANLGINFKPTMQSQINTVNGISNKTITPTPMIQDKQTDTDVERGFYALGNVLAGDNANTVLGGLRYDLTRGVTGAVGAVEGVTDFVVGLYL